MKTNSKLEVLVGVASAAEHHTPAPPPPSTAAVPWDSREGGASSRHMAYLMRGNLLKIKNGEEQQKWRRRERSVMYNIYTLQLGLRLELRISPKEVTLI